jgi:hypothetical protein
MNAFRMTHDRSLDRYYLRTCAIYRLLKGGHVDKAGALAIAGRPIRGIYAKPDRLNGTIELWLAGPLRNLAGEVN